MISPTLKHMKQQNSMEQPEMVPKKTNSFPRLYKNYAEW